MEKNKIYSIAIALFLCLGGGAVGYFANSEEPTICPEPTPCPICPEPTPCPICPEPTPCPICPEPTPCPICPVTQAQYDALQASFDSTKEQLDNLNADYTDLNTSFNALKAQYDMLYATTQKEIITLNEWVRASLFDLFKSEKIYDRYGLPSIATGDYYTMTIKVMTDWKSFEKVAGLRAYQSKSVTVEITYYMLDGTTESVTYDLFILLVKNGEPMTDYTMINPGHMAPVPAGYDGWQMGFYWNFRSV